ncbi:MAG: hypothetical protein ACYS7Y_16585 [Planctomycetota bacterium]
MLHEIRPKIIGICGHDFCGSTLLSRLFAAIPSVASGGELRWLIDDPDNRGTCCVCGDQCPVFTPSMKQWLTQENLYESVAAAMGKDILVSSDKGWFQYKRFVKKGTMRGIVLFRSLEGVASSDKKHQTVWPITNRSTVEASLVHWVKVYRKLFRWVNRYCKDSVFLSYESLVKDHQGVMTKLCDRLGIPLEGEFPAGPLVTDYHNVLGNPSAHKSSKVTMDRSWKNRLTDSEVHFLRNHREANQLLAQMKKRALV